MTGDEWIRSPKDVMMTRFRIAQQNTRGKDPSSPDAPLGLETENAGLNHGEV
jgi:hypothetical protein